MIDKEKNTLAVAEKKSRDLQTKLDTISKARISSFMQLSNSDVARALYISG